MAVIDRGRSDMTDRDEDGREREKKAEFEAEALVHVDSLYGLALRLTGGNASRAEDLVQEALLKAYRAWGDFRLGTNCRAWLMTILRNTFINDFRRQQRRPQTVDFEDVADRAVFSEVMDTDPAGGFFDRIIDEEVIAAIDEHRQPLCNMYEARGATEMIAAVFESHRQKRPVKLPLENRQNPLTMLK